MLECEVARTRQARLEVLEQRVDEGRLSTEAGEQGQINIDCQARLSPPLERYAAYETEPPAALHADCLNGFRGPKDLKNGAAPA